KTVPTHILGRVMALLTTANTSVMSLGTLYYTFILKNNFNGCYIFIIFKCQIKLEILIAHQ
ncbi:hypothetical protein E5289_06495, partial [Lactiplantibacillus pentosus]